MKNRIVPMCKKGIALLVAAGFICLLGPTVYSVQSAEVVDRIVAIVNEDIIRLSDLNREFEPIKQQIRSRGMSADREAEAMYEARSQLIEEMVDEKLADQAIKEAGIRVSKNEVDAAIERIKSANRFTQEDLKRALESRGMRMEKYREDMRQQILRNKLINEKVKSKIVITEDDIREHYEANPEKYGLTEKYRLKNIFMPFDEAQVRSKLEKVLEELENGASFAEMAKKHSMAPNANAGGDLGVFALQDLSEDLQPVVEALEPGQFTDIVQTDLGLQIFFLESVEEPEERDLEDVKERIEQELYEEKAEQKFNDWIESLRKSAHIRIIQ